ncbi:GNAT family N-acetyltransferase [Pseudomonas quasicaspiana]|uniref:GNAT family N-acetyltransferase n=1 Tax=Pseudomonas quasicaspiana TaxID=2829821 RepID=UPI001E3D8848|nr:GNAT family N-acetyltransferase [Pseudomonas quasicaspiana]MCD5973079.1 GNAT family N-acetyltransferase [Pseudomonas quasicaspiana]
MNTQVVSYETLNEVQRQQLDALEILPEQLPFSGDIYCALNTLLVRPSPNIQGVALLMDAKPVGFLLLKRGEFLPHWAVEGSATLHALQIDHRVQGKGLGKVFLQGLPQVARATWPDIGQLMLSVDADNLAALNLYVGQGWVDTGEAYKGRIGYERRLVLGL